MRARGVGFCPARPFFLPFPPPPARGENCGRPGREAFPLASFRPPDLTRWHSDDLPTLAGRASHQFRARGEFQVGLLSRLATSRHAIRYGFSPNRGVSCGLPSAKRTGQLRFERLEPRRLLAILGLDMQCSRDTDGDSIPDTEIDPAEVVVGEVFWVEILVEDRIDLAHDPDDEAAGVIGLPLDITWNPNVVNYVGRTTIPPATTAPEDDPVVTPDFPLQRGGTLDEQPELDIGAWEDLRGAAIPAGGLGSAIGAEGREWFARLKFQAVATGVSLIDVGLDGSMSFADGDPLTGMEIEPADGRTIHVGPATISGEKWHDDNASQAYDEGEAYLEGWEIRAYRDIDEDGLLDQNEFDAGPVAIDDTTVDEGYTLEIEALLPALDSSSDPGSYSADFVVVEQLQDGWVQTFPETAVLAPGLNTEGVRLGSSGYTATIDQQAQAFVDRVFGNDDVPTSTAQIIGFKWHDQDGDAQWDANEPGLNGWSIYLDLNENGEPDPEEPARITANNGERDGRYHFNNLQPGTYTVRELLPSDWGQTWPNALVDGQPAGAWEVTVEADQVVEADFGVAEDLNFGNAQASLAGFVYSDDDLDDTFTRDENGAPIEPGIPNVPVSLYRRADTAEYAFMTRVTTGPDGWYHFEGLGPGTYRIVEDLQPACFRDGSENLGIVLPPHESRGTVGDDQFTDIALKAGEHGIDYNFRETGMLPECINKRLFLASTPSPLTVIGQRQGVRVGTVSGTDGDDSIRFEKVEDRLRVTVNAAAQEFDLDDYDILAIDAGPGQDEVTLVGSEVHDIARLLPTYTTLRSSNHYTPADYAVEVRGVEDLSITTDTGDDLVVVRDSRGDDSMAVGNAVRSDGGDGASVEWQADDSTVALLAEARAMEVLRAISIEGGDDQAEKRLPVDFVLQLLGDWTESP